MTGNDTLILLPGMLCDERLYVRQISYLSERCQVIVPSLAHDDSLEAMAWRVLATAPPRFALCGYSMGGSLALEIMRLAGDRVTRLAILSAHEHADDQKRIAGRKALIADVLGGQFEAVCVRLLRGILSPYWRDNARWYHACLSMMLEHGPDVFVRQQNALMTRSEATSVLPKIRCPVIVMSGALDPIAPLPLQLQLAAAMNARHVLCRQAAHVLPVEAPWAVRYWLGEWLRW